MNINVYSYDDILTAINTATTGDTLTFYLKNDIFFTATINILLPLEIEFINDSGNEFVTLGIQTGGTFRHFTTGYVALPTALHIKTTQGVIIDGNSTGGGFVISGNNCHLEFENCQLTNCYSTSNGAAIIIYGDEQRSNLTLKNVLIDKCYTPLSGAILGGNCEIVIEDSHMTDNHARLSANAIVVFQLSNNIGSTLDIKNSLFDYNTLSGNTGNGGAIATSSTMITIQDSEFSYNSSGTNGGAIRVGGAGLSAIQTGLIAQNTKFLHNKTANNGGAVSTDGNTGDVTLINCIFSNNETTGGTTTIYNGGGAISVINGTSLSITDCEITNNNSSAHGGAICFYNGAILTISGNTTISNNTALLNAGAIYAYDHTDIIINANTTISSNEAKCNNDETYLGGGGAISIITEYAQNARLIVSSANISNNKSISYGGAIYIASAQDTNTKVELNNATITDNNAHYGGGIYNNNALIEIKETNFTNNTAVKNGGAIYTTALENIKIDTIDEKDKTIFEDNKANHYHYWTLSDTPDSLTHQNNIFTKNFSNFIPIGNIDLDFSFTNAYNNYDINYDKDIKDFNINFLNQESLLIESLTIQSFLGAQVTIYPIEHITDSEQNDWYLYPETQTEITKELMDPLLEYNYDFYYRQLDNKVTVKEQYLDICKNPVRRQKTTIVEKETTFQTNPLLLKYHNYLGYKINNGPLQEGNIVIIPNINEDTLITFIYKLKRTICC